MPVTIIVGHDAIISRPAGKLELTCGSSVC